MAGKKKLTNRGNANTAARRTAAGPQLPRPTSLPSPGELGAHCIGLAALDAVRGLRFQKYSAVTKGDLTTFVLDRGNGDELQVVFAGDECLVRGFDHECERSPFMVGHVWPGTYTGLPEVFRPAVAVPEGAAYDGDLFGDSPGKEGRLRPTTFGKWWNGEGWVEGQLALGAPDGGFDYLFGCLDASIDFDGFDRTIALRIFEGHPITDDELRTLKADVDLPTVRAAWKNMGYGVV